MIFSLIDLCSEPAFLGVIFFIKQLLRIAWILIPLGLIVMAMVDLAKSVLANGTDEMAKNGKVLIKRTILCIALYLIPTFVNAVINLMGDGVLDSNFVTCYKRAQLDTILKLSNNNDSDSSNDSSDNFDDYVNSAGGTTNSTGNNSDKSSSNSIKQVTRIKLNKKKLKLQISKKATLKATISPKNASNKNLKWTSSNLKVAIVSQKGKVTAKKAGKAIITVSSSNGKTAKCTVTVTGSNIMKIPNIKQGDPKYFGYTFPVHSGASMAGNGCGIVSVTMVLQYLTGKNIPVETVATWADQNGHFNGIGSNGSLFGAAAQKWNVGNVTTTRNINTVIKALQKGRPVVSLQNRGLFTQAMHFIVLTGIDDKGKIHVNDPNGSHTRSVYTKREVNQNNNTYYIFDAKK